MGLDINNFYGCVLIRVFLSGVNYGHYYNYEWEAGKTLMRMRLKNTFSSFIVMDGFVVLYVTNVLKYEQDIRLFQKADYFKKLFNLISQKLTE